MSLPDPPDDPSAPSSVAAAANPSTAAGAGRPMVVIVMPAYNAAKTLEHVIDKLPAERKPEFATAVGSAQKNDKSSTYTQWDKILGKLK